MDDLAAAFGRMTLADAMPDTRQLIANSPFPFMRLPKELRLAVYELVFQDHIDDLYIHNRTKLEYVDRPALASSYRVATCHKTYTMFHVNRAMRQESFDVCYRLLMMSIRSIYADQDFRPVNDLKLLRERRKARFETRAKVEDRNLEKMVGMEFSGPTKVRF